MRRGWVLCAVLLFVLLACDAPGTVTQAPTVARPTETLELFIESLPVDTPTMAPGLIPNVAPAASSTPECG